MATIKQVANKIGKDLNESYPNIQNLFDVLKRGFKDMEDVTGGGGGGSEVDWTQLQVSGTKIAEIEIDGDKTNVYAPTSQTIAVSQIQTTGTKIASISLDGVSTDLYAPNGGGSSYIEVEHTVTNVATTAWGSIYSADIPVDITSYGFQTPPVIESIIFQPDGSAGTGVAYLGTVTATSILVGVFRGPSGSLGGKIRIKIKMP